jgi:hypothetical protein
MVDPPQSELLSTHILIDGTWLQSRIPRINLEKLRRVFPFAATREIELNEWAGSMKEMIHRYWSEAIKMIAVCRAQGFLSDHIGEDYRPGTLRWGSVREEIPIQNIKYPLIRFKEVLYEPRIPPIIPAFSPW